MSMPGFYTRAIVPTLDDDIGDNADEQGFDPQAIMVGGGGVGGVADVVVRMKGYRGTESVTLKLLLNTIYEISVNKVYTAGTNGTNLLILGNNR